MVILVKFQMKLKKFDNQSVVHHVMGVKFTQKTTSILRVVYHEILQTSKEYMRDITVVSREIVMKMYATLAVLTIN